MEAREAAIRRMLPTVRAIARRVRVMVPGAEMDDLIGDGCVGLIRAVDRFDPARGTSLAHYAHRLILGSMLNGIRRMDPVSERARREIRESERERYKLALERGEVPDLGEMLRRRPSLEGSLRQARDATPLSLDTPLPIGVRAPVDVDANPAEVTADRMQRRAMRAAVRALPWRQRYVVAQHYFAERSLREISNDLAVSSQRASQLHRIALARLRKVSHAATD